MTLEGYFPALAQITNFGLQSIILLDNSWGANPPNTTTWGAPILAQAKIAITLYIIFGIYIITGSPALRLKLLFKLPVNSDTRLWSSA